MLIKQTLPQGKSNMMMRPAKKSAPIFSLAHSSCDAETMFILLVITEWIRVGIWIRHSSIDRCQPSNGRGMVGNWRTTLCNAFKHLN